MRRRLLALLVVALVSGTVAGAVANASGRWAGPQGARIPPLPALPEVANSCPIPALYRSAFRTAAHDTGLPLAMLVAVGQVESNLQADARSSADARGLLQVLPSTAAELRLDVDHPASNVLAGARYLEQLLERFRSADLALAAYNAGPTAVAEAGGAPTAETVDYVANVTALWRELRGCR
jgi:soluble lytic murein transglycosylase-like protein